MMKRLIAFLLVMFLPSVSMALVGSIDHRIYADWSSPEYNKIVYFDTGRGTCTAEYVYRDIILTARHCITSDKKFDKYEKLGGSYEIILHDGRRTNVVLERYGEDWDHDWALLRVKDSNFFRNDYFDIASRTETGPVKNGGFGYTRIFTNEQIRSAKRLWDVAEKKFFYFEDILEDVKANLLRQGIKLVDDSDEKTGARYRFKADDNCGLSNFSGKTYVATTCDTTQGNSGGPYFRNGVLHGVVHAGVGAFDNTYTDRALRSDTLLGDFREMQILSGGGSDNWTEGKPLQVNAEICKSYDSSVNVEHATTCDCTKTNGKINCQIKYCEEGYNKQGGICIKDTTMCWIENTVYAKSGEKFWVYAAWGCKRLNTGMDLTNAATCECRCNNGVSTCKIDKCNTGYHSSKDGRSCLDDKNPNQNPTPKPDSVPAPNPASVPTPNPEPAAKMCVANGKEYANGANFTLSAASCANQNAALNLTNVASCACDCNDGKVSCEIEKCADGRNPINNKCPTDSPVATQPTDNAPVSNHQKCISNGKVYADGASFEVGLIMCPQYDNSLVMTRVNTCKCTCNDGKISCEVNGCADGYRPDGKRCVAQNDSTTVQPVIEPIATGGQPDAISGDQESLVKRPSYENSGIIKNTVTEPGLSAGEQASIQEDIETETAALEAEAHTIASKSDEEFYRFLKRAVDLDVLRKNYEDALARERALPNRILSAAAIGAGGIGGAMLGAAIAEQRADAAAEQEMQAYLQSVRCEYGNGKSVPGGQTNVELPGGNDMVALYTEYATLANDLKIRKDALGLRPGIESEVVIDKADTGLYDNVGVGIVGGGYASIARALMNPDGDDAKAWAAQREKTATTFKTGGIVAGTGIVGGAVGNIAINGFDGKKLDVNLDPTDSESGESQITE